MRSRTKLIVPVVLVLAVASAFTLRATAQAKPTPPAAELQQSGAPSTGLPAVDAQAPAVRIVMFWANGCPHCHAVLDQVLPPLQAQYGDQLQVHLIEVSPEATLQRFFQVAAALGIDQNDVFVPFLMIGDQVLIGSQEIPARLPGLIETYLAAGGADYPDLPELAPLLPAEIATASNALPQEAAVVAATPQPTLAP